jgi:hypothetical protein
VGSSRVTVLAAVVAANALAACSAIDTTVSPRTYTVNMGWDAYRNNALLLNVARASHSAPLQFVGIGDYTGTGDIEASAAAQFVYAPGDLNPTQTFGPFNASAKTTNDIKLSTLETGDFYAGMLTEVPLSELYWLLRQGVPREIAFHVLVSTIKVVRPDGAAFDFRNDPVDNYYPGPEGLERNSPECLAVRDSVPFAHPMWLGRHEQHCRYEKFRRFIQLAIEFGLTVEWPFKGDARFCYDAALAREHGHPGVQNSALACGARIKSAGTAGFSFRTPTGQIVTVGTIVPVLRSPMGVFRFLGGLLTTGAAETVLLNTADPQTQDARLLTVGPGLFGCFAQAEYLGQLYCVPATGAQNTKNVFSMLTALVALHTRRADLPPASTIVVRP